MGDINLQRLGGEIYCIFSIILFFYSIIILIPTLFLSLNNFILIHLFSYSLYLLHFFFLFLFLNSVKLLHMFPLLSRLILLCLCHHVQPKLKKQRNGEKQSHRERNKSETQKKRRNRRQRGTQRNEEIEATRSRENTKNKKRRDQNRQGGKFNSNSFAHSNPST